MKSNSPKIVGVIAAIALAWSCLVADGIAQTGKPVAAPPPPVKTPANAPGTAAATTADTATGKAGDNNSRPADGTQVAAAPRARGRSRANEDARHCLQLTTIRAIIICAEKYL